MSNEENEYVRRHNCDERQRQRLAAAGGERDCRGQRPVRLHGGVVYGGANLNPLLITGNDYGGQVSITYEVENYPGFPDGLSGPELVEKMKEQAEKFGTHRI